MVSWALKIRGQRPIGLDIGHNSIKMIQLLIDDEQISVIAADESRIDAGVNSDEQTRRSFVISAIKRMLANGSFQGRNVVSCLPSDKLRITSLRLAEAEKFDIEQALRREVTHRFGLDPDRDSMDYMVAGSVQQGDEIKSELIMFATDNETIKNHIATLEEAELKPVAIDTIPCALFRCFERSLRRQEDRDRTAVFVDVGSCFTTVVFGRGGEISFIKQIPIGGQKFTQEIATKLGVNVNEAETLQETLRLDPGLFSQKSEMAEQESVENPHNIDMSTRQVIVDAVSAVAEDLVREISLCLRYYTVTFRGKRVERAVFAGGGAYEDILLNILKRRLAVEIEQAQPLRGFDLTNGRINVNFNSDTRGLFCEWAVAVGLGLKRLDKITSGRRQAKNGLRESYERN
ncbi:MAG: pilus assembly protein PilM [Planctomycetota bacterium]|jgi:type IV pilus assembly protein PilM